MEKSSSGLVRSLSLKDAVMIGIASMIGGAIFVLVGPGMAQAGAALMIAFLLNGVITVFTALTYAELGSAFPATGGGYRWVKQGLPRPNAYLVGGWRGLAILLQEVFMQLRLDHSLVIFYRHQVSLEMILDSR